MALAWIAQRLHMGARTHVSNLLRLRAVGKESVHGEG
jgi:hypothetical protein